MKRVYALVVMMVVLAACGDATPTAAPATNPAGGATTPAVTGAVDPAKMSKELRVFAWGEYIPDAVVQGFEKEYGVNVTVDTYSSNEEMAAKVRVGNSGYDIVQPSDYMVALLAEGGFLAELDKANISNLSNASPQNMGLYYDPENKYSLPYLWGTTGIAYDTTVLTTPPDSWSAIFDPNRIKPYEKRVSMLNDEREAIGAAMLYLGKPLNSSQPTDLEAAKQVLLAQKPMLAKYNSDNVNQDLATGEVVLAHCWNGYAAMAMLENPNIGWVIPKEGGVIWQDNVAILKDAPHKYTAEVFINYLMRPETAAEIVNFTGYMTPITAAESMISADIKDLYQKVKPDEATMSRLEWLRRGENPTLFSDVWAAVRSQ